MRFYKQYPRIVLLLAFSICLCLFGIGLFYSSAKFVYVPYDPPPKDEPPPPFAKSKANITKPKTNNDEPSTLVKEVGKAKVKYYPNRASTISTTDYFYGYSDNINRINMQAFIETFGKKVYAPENIKLCFEYSSIDERYRDKFFFGIVLKGETVFEKNTALDLTYDGNKYFATLTLEIPYELFVKIAKEKNMRFLFGFTVIDLAGKHIEPFTDLLKTIEPATSKRINQLHHQQMRGQINQ